VPFPDPFYRWRPHPWHGLDAGSDPPRVVKAYIEITPFDLVKYEVDKATGYLKVDRPQRSSSAPPTLYGFIPRTYCAKRVGALCPGAKGGDTDPLDICVISERPINRAEVILSAKVVGGLQCIDHNEADDKIVAVLRSDNVWGGAETIEDLPKVTIERLRHYFSTYKLIPDQPAPLSVESVYGRDHAHKVIQAALDDYNEEFGA
jgi:inorganic pyrophosphatase